MADLQTELLQQIAAELKTIRQDIHNVKDNVSKLMFAISDAESEVPEKMRRFMMYMHDVHDIRNMYIEGGHPCPEHVNREIERCDDRYRQLLKELHLDGGTFEQVRRKMADDPENRWDHTRLLQKPKGTEDETGTSKS